MTPLNLDRVQNWINQGRIDPSRPITIKELGDSRCINPSKVGDGIKLLARGAAETQLSHPLNIVVSRASKAAISAVESAGGSVLTRYYTPFSIRRIMQGKTDPINSLQSQAPSAFFPSTTTTAAAAAAAVMRMPTFPSSSSSSTPSSVAEAADVVVEPRGESVREERGEEEEGMIGRKEEEEEEEEKGDVKKLVFWQNRLPDPVSRKAIEYYRDPAHRGYLSYQVGQGQGPSLFFKTPRPPPGSVGGDGDGVGVGGVDADNSTSTASATTSTKSKKKGQAAANRIW